MENVHKLGVMRIRIFKYEFSILADLDVVLPCQSRFKLTVVVGFGFLHIIIVYLFNDHKYYTLIWHFGLRCTDNGGGTRYGVRIFYRCSLSTERELLLI